MGGYLDGGTMSCTPYDLPFLLENLHGELDTECAALDAAIGSGKPREH